MPPISPPDGPHPGSGPACLELALATGGRERSRGSDTSGIAWRTQCGGSQERRTRRSTDPSENIRRRGSTPGAAPLHLREVDRANGSQAVMPQYRLHVLPWSVMSSHLAHRKFDSLLQTEGSKKIAQSFGRQPRTTQTRGVRTGASSPAIVNNYHRVPTRRCLDRCLDQSTDLKVTCE